MDITTTLINMHNYYGNAGIHLKKTDSWFTTLQYPFQTSLGGDHNHNYPPLALQPVEGSNFTMKGVIKS